MLIDSQRERHVAFSMVAMIAKQRAGVHGKTTPHSVIEYPARFDLRSQLRSQTRPNFDQSQSSAR